MTIGAGRYDDLCTYVREQAGIDYTSHGGAIIIVINGKLGSGFSCQADVATTAKLPALLEEMARAIRQDFIGMPPP